MIGILYDNVNWNTGDEAIGISLKKILSENKIKFKEGVSDTTIIGGGHLLRNSDLFYDRFKLNGNHILNCMGIVDFPTDLQYLSDYKYVTVRSNGDKDKIKYISNVNVVPCTTMLLEDIKDVPTPQSPSLGIHILPAFLNKKENNFIKWVSKLPFNVYFIPLTFYNYDYVYMNELSKKIKNSIAMPYLNPLEVFTFIGKLDYFISCSLHGAIFAYRHNVPFILIDSEKMRFFMEDRGLENYIFNDYNSLKQKFCLRDKDYSDLIEKDLKVLKEHIYNIKQIVK